MEKTLDNDDTQRSGERPWLIWSTVLTLFLALVLTVVQQTLLLHIEQNSLLRDFILRFLWNSLFFSLVTLLFSRVFLAGWILLVAVFQTAVLYYFSYFGTPPTYSILSQNLDEGLEVADAVFGMFPWKIFALFLLLAAVQLCLQFFRDRHRIPMKKRLILALLCLVGISGMFMGLNRGFRALTSRYVYPLEPKIAKFGLLPVCFQEMVYLKRTPIESILAAAAADEELQSDLLRDEYSPPTPPKTIVVIQAESLDYAVLRHRVQGKEVTPFLNGLADRSLEFRVWAMHDYGSATSDFVLLNGIPPAEGLFNYNIPGYPFNTSLPVFLRENGYRTFAIHGVRGSFYNRINAFTGMQFDHIAFKQDIVDAYTQRPEKLEETFPSKTVDQIQEENWLQDDLVLAYSQWMVDEHRDGNRFYFIITATSHGPFRMHDRHDIVEPENDIQDRYFNSINRLDQDLRAFYEKLPEETLFIVYGDHTPNFTSGKFLSDIEDDKEYVPLLIGVKGQNLRRLQRTETDPENEVLSLRDAYSYLKKVVRGNAVSELRVSEASEPSRK